MAWIDRNVGWPVLLISATVIASCTSTAIPPEEGCQGAQCAGQGGKSDSETAGSSGKGSGGQSCVPGINCPADSAGKGGSGGSTTGSSGSGVVAGTGNGATAGGTGPGAGGSGPVAGTGPGAGGSAPVAGTGTGGDTTGSGGDTTGSGGTGGSMSVPLGSIQVDAGALARDHSIVRFPLADLAEKNLVLKDAQGNQIPLQVSLADGNATFVLPMLPAGQQATYTIEELTSPLPNAVATSVGEDQQLHMKAGDAEIFRWMLVPDNFRNKPANDVRAGYIYPLYTPAGLNVTDDYAEDHPHMHGLWSAWTLTTFRGNKVDFWNGYDNSGHVDLESMERAWSGPVHGGLIAHIKHEAIKYDPWVKVLGEKWVVTVYKTHDGPAPYYIFDIDSVQEAVTADALVLEQYHYGGFGFRGSGEWQNAAGQFLTSEGLNRSNGDGSNAKWCAQFGTVTGKVGGYAALSHPSNFRNPQGLRLHPENPYWSFTPVTAASGGRTQIDPGKPYVSRYRIVAFDGAADAAFINRLWNDFATPPTVTVLP